MKTTKLMTIMAIGAGLTFGVIAQARVKKHEEESVSSSNVPTAVQQAAENQGKILRWEKEGNNYEAVVEKNGKQWGIEISPRGKVLKKHPESNEHKEMGEKH